MNENTSNYRIRRNRRGIGGWEIIKEYNNLADFELGIQNLEMEEEWSYFNEQEVRTWGTIRDENKNLVWSSPHYIPFNNLP